MKTLDDVEQLASSSDAPTVAMVYQSDSTRLESSQYECTPLACFYPQYEPNNPSPKKRRFDLGFDVSSPPQGSRTRNHAQASTSQQHFLQSSTSTGQSDSMPLTFATSKQPPIDPRKIPVEVFELIAQHLPLSDVKSMRLVDKAFERGVSGHLFENVVVPFTIDIYGALASGLGTIGTSIDAKGKGKERSNAASTSDVSRRQAALKQQKERLDVFRGFGSHIRRFGINFVVNEQELSIAMPKEVHQGHNEYWGDFRWPFPEYPRFEDRAGLESTADETSTMKDALRHLNNVKYLALSIDSGLGWLSGADLSMRSRILGAPPHPFARLKQAIEPDVEKRRRLWTIIENAYETAENKSALKAAELVRYEKAEALRFLSGEQRSSAARVDAGVVHSASIDTLNTVMRAKKMNDRVDRLLRETEPRLPSTIASTITNLTQTGTVNTPRPRRPFGLSLLGRNRRSAREVTRVAVDQLRESAPISDARVADNAAVERAPPQATTIAPPDEDHGRPQHGILYTRPLEAEDESLRYLPSRLSPNSLSQTQREWLMETAWAQDAFLSSYMISIIDNREALRSVRTLTLSPFSSCHLTKLIRPDFWSSLPGLDSLELLVSPDWRQIERRPAGYTSAVTVSPSKTLDSLYFVMDSIIASLKNIEHMTLGWASGGEHAEGLNARNRLLMPAPLTSRHQALPAGDLGLSMLTLPHVRQLTLVNCWIAPNVLQEWIRRHLSHNLGSLVLESVSLTGHPKYPANAAGAAGAAAQLAGGNGINPMVQQLQQQMQQVQNAWQGGVAQAPPVAQMQQMAQNGPNANQGNNPGNAVWNNGHIPANIAAGQPQLAQQQQPNAQAQPGPLRDGSWPTVLSKVQNWSTLFHKALTVTLASCGYALLPRATFDQSEIELAVLNLPNLDNVQDRQMSAWFTQRRTIVGETLMAANDNMLGRVATWLPINDLSPLEEVWHLAQGWPRPDIPGNEYDDEDGWSKWGWRTKEAAEYDGERAGGSGRFSGAVSFPVWTEEDE